MHLPGISQKYVEQLTRDAVLTVLNMLDLNLCRARSYLGYTKDLCMYTTTCYNGISNPNKRNIMELRTSATKASAARKAYIVKYAANPFINLSDIAKVVGRSQQYVGSVAKEAGVLEKREEAYKTFCKRALPPLKTIE